jgi:hypothetical protein
MRGDKADFIDALEAVLGGTADEAQCRFLDVCLREDPECLRIYGDQMELHLLLRVSCEREDVECPSRSAGGTPCRPGKRWSAGVSASRGSGWRKVAAAAVLLLGGVAVWQSVPLLSGIADCRLPIADSSVSPVALVRQMNVRGLDVPSELPGTLRLSSGEVVVRLGSGVVLTVLGPASLEIHDVMRVALEKGRLLADVPHWATGFTVRTADLDVCDLGTVFSVSVDWPVSDVFVFKGRVRVSEAGHGTMGNATAGEAVGICEAGEGVRAETGERPVKFSADWPAAKKMFAAVRNQAAEGKPAVAFAFAEKVADVWADGYLSRELSRIGAQRQTVASAPKIPFRKTAWVRPAVPRQEASNMKTTSAAAVLTAAAVMMGSGTAGAVSEPAWVNASPVENRCWETVYSNEVDVAWRWDAWPTNAVSAELFIEGMNGTALVTNVTRSVSNVVWRAFATQSPTEENVFNLRLTFYTSGSAIVGAQTSRLAVVKGAFGKTAVMPAPEGTLWPKVKENAVIPYDAGWTEATCGASTGQLVIAKAEGVTQTNALTSVAGFFGWKIKRSEWGYGSFNLALTFPGTDGEWDATLTRPLDGTMIRMQ